MDNDLNMKNKLTAPEAVRVRFAPSPTGYLHIGSARTALFNWLYAKKTKGKFILRIEDTDLSRHIEESVGLTMDSLRWLGMNWDEGPDIGGNYGPYRQSQRKDIYREFADRLIGQNKAYFCFCAPGRLSDSDGEGTLSDEDREKTYKYDRHCLNLTKEEVCQKIEDGVPHTIRFLVPQDLIVTFDDLVYGKIKIDSNVIEDFIIIRSNGLPTYNFSAAIDDMLMEITHVIRGEDHLSNTPKQVLIYKSLETPLPEFIHLPMILGPDGQKLSKRHGSVSIEAFREEGFLPEAINNFVALLGWSYDEKTTIFSVPELIGKFSLEKINKKPARFDYERLIWLNGNYIRTSETEKLENLMREKFESRLADKPDFRKKLFKIIPLLKERIKTLNEASQFIFPFFDKPSYSKEKILEELGKSKEESSAGTSEFFNVHLLIIKESIGILETFEKFDSKKIEGELKTLPEKLDKNFRKIAEAIRIAVWGHKVSPPLFETICILGKKESLKRLNNYRTFLEI
jgi:glutamyl-tRNA synthetase